MTDGNSEFTPAIPGVERILREDLRIETPGIGETAIILQRHGQYIRDAANPNIGSITPDAAVQVSDLATGVMRGVLEDLSSEDRKKVDVMVIGSSTKFNGGGARSLETAKVELDAIREVFVGNNLNASQILNDKETLSTTGDPIPSGTIVEPKIFDNSPEFVEWLESYTGGDRDLFWRVYEADQGEVRAKRQETGAEGPNEMADRLSHFVNALRLYSEKYHKDHPERRLILWAVTHTDTIVPFIKKKINGTTDGDLRSVDYGGGIGINIHKDGTATTKLGDKNYPIDLVKAPTASSID